MRMWKVMKKEGEYLVSLSDPRVMFWKPSPGDVLAAGRDCRGIWVGPEKGYVLEHYFSGPGANEVLLELDVKTESILKGDLNDREPELSVEAAEVLSLHKIHYSQTEGVELSKFRFPF